MPDDLAALRTLIDREVSRVEAIDDDVEREAAAKELSAQLAAAQQRFRRARSSALSAWMRKPGSTFRLGAVVFGLSVKTIRDLLGR